MAFYALRNSDWLTEAPAKQECKENFTDLWRVTTLESFIPSGRNAYNDDYRYWLLWKASTLRDNSIKDPSDEEDLFMNKFACFTRDHANLFAGHYYLNFQGSKVLASEKNGFDLEPYLSMAAPSASETIITYVLRQTYNMILLLMDNNFYLPVGLRNLQFWRCSGAKFHLRLGSFPEFRVEPPKFYASCKTLYLNAFRDMVLTLKSKVPHSTCLSHLLDNLTAGRLELPRDMRHGPLDVSRELTEIHPWTMLWLPNTPVFPIDTSATGVQRLLS